MDSRWAAHGRPGSLGSHFDHSGLVTKSGKFASADIVVHCTSCERNASLVPALPPCTQSNSINCLDQDVMYLADALLDDAVFNSLFGSSVLEMVASATGQQSSAQH